MKKEIADLWVKALRSGEYAQGRWALESALGTFCCLGVLCDVASKAGVCRATQTDGSATYYDERNDTPPRSVLKWSGLKDDSGCLEGHKALTELNDDEGWTFSEIADHIEQHWEAL